MFLFLHDSAQPVGFSRRPGKVFVIPNFVQVSETVKVQRNHHLIHLLSCVPSHDSVALFRAYVLDVFFLSYKILPRDLRKKEENMISGME